MVRRQLDGDRVAFRGCDQRSATSSWPTCQLLRRAGLKGPGAEQMAARTRHSGAGAAERVEPLACAAA